MSCFSNKPNDCSCECSCEHQKKQTHVHDLWTNTDFFEDHHHELRKIQTGLAIEVGAGKHVHFVQGMTTINDDHAHNFVFATLIECPISTKCK